MREGKVYKETGEHAGESNIFSPSHNNKHYVIGKLEKDEMKIHTQSSTRASSDPENLMQNRLRDLYSRRTIQMVVIYT